MNYHYVLTLFCPVTGFVHSLSLKRHSAKRTIEKTKDGKWKSESRRIEGNTGYQWIDHRWVYNGSIGEMHVEIIVFN